MKIKIPPIDAGFVDRILFFNLTRDFFYRENVFKDLNVHIVFILPDYCVGVDMENYLFYAYNKETEEMFGPYAHYEELIGDVLFGLYDGLFFVLSKIKYNNTLGVYEFDYDGFNYNINTYKTLNFKQTAEKLSQTIKKINQPPVFTFTPETSFSDNVIDNFLIDLNNVFQKDNFPFKHIKNKYVEIIRIDRADILGVKKPNDLFFTIVNTSHNNGLTIFVPYWMHEDFATFSSTTKDEFIDELFSVDEKIQISNENEILLAQRIFNIDESSLEKDVYLFKCNIFKYLELVINGEKLDEIVYVLKKDNKFYSLKFNVISKHFLLEDFKTFTSNGIEVFEKNGYLIIGKDCDKKESEDIIINVNECICINNITGIARIGLLEFDSRFLINHKGAL